MDRILNLILGVGSSEGDRRTLTGRTAADDLREQGYMPSAGGNTAVEDDGSEFDLDDRADDTADRDEFSASQDKASGKPGRDDDDVEDFGETDESDPQYKKRFVNSQKEYLATKQSMQAIQDELAALREQLAQNGSARTQPRQEMPPRSPINTEETARRLNDELRSIDEKDAKASEKKVGAWVNVVKNTAEITAETAVENALAKKKAMEIAYAQAQQAALSALKETGLREDHYPLFDREVAYLKASDPDFFSRVPPKQQFKEIATRVKDTMASYTKGEQKKNTDRIREANEAHQRQASGVIHDRSTSRPHNRDAKKNDVPDRPFSQQMRDAQQARFEEGRRRATRS